MKSFGRFFAAAFAPVLMVGGVAGCATYEKCGISGCPGDAQITANVEALFNRNPPLGPPNELSVQTLDRVVYLNGVADTPFELRLAESVAGEAAGVKRVVNNIGLSGSR